MSDEDDYLAALPPEEQERLTQVLYDAEWRKALEAHLRTERDRVTVLEEQVKLLEMRVKELEGGG